MTQFRISETVNKQWLHPPKYAEVNELDKRFSRQYIEKNREQLISFSQEIKPIDLLSFLATIAQPNHPYLYWENPRESEAIIGYGVTESLTIDAGDRFNLAQIFIAKCLAKTVTLGDLDLPGSGPHFLCSFSFFDQDTSRTSFHNTNIFLPEIQIYRRGEKCVLVINTKVEKLQQIRSKLAFLNSKIKQNSPYQQSAKRSLNRSFKIQENGQEFENAVKSALASIEQKKFSKIVLAHPVNVLNTQAFDLIGALDTLRHNHRDCYTFALSNGNNEQFIGSSPERLITVAKGQLATDALAGSAPRGKTPEEDAAIAQALLSNEKERREHLAVSNFIVENLEKLGLNPQVMPLRLLKLSHIQHLWTPIYAQLPTNLNPLSIVAQLHPTPAVAGVPREIVCKEIQQYENFARGLYAAPLGWVDYQGNSKFIVGIRSALIQGDRARLYGGAGIVAGSVPAKEYAEVQLKIQSLLQALY